MNAIVSKPDEKIITRNKRPRPTWWLFLIAICSILAIVAHWKDAEFLDEDPNGNPILGKKRQQELENALKEFDEAEQYALLADNDGYFPCYNCKEKPTIYLYKGEVWRYGTTTKGQKGRYGNSLTGKELVYIIQFKGTLQDCLKQEKLKIFNYATLPENIKRPKPLIRPPGNKVDR